MNQSKTPLARREQLRMEAFRIARDWRDEPGTDRAIFLGFNPTGPNERFCELYDRLPGKPPRKFRADGADEIQACRRALEAARGVS